MASHELVERFRPDMMAVWLGGSRETRLHFWLGDWRNVEHGRLMDRKVKIFLRKMWRIRRPLTGALDRALARSDTKLGWGTSDGCK